MKIKIIKKFNAFFLLLLLSAAVSFMSVTAWSSWENLKVGKTSVVGKASRIGLVSDMNDSNIVLTDAALMSERQKEQKETSFVVFGNFPFFEDLLGVDQKTAFFVGDLVGTDLSQVDNKREEMAKSKKIMADNFEKFHVVFGTRDISCGKQCADLWVEELFGFKNSDFGEVLLYNSVDYENVHFVFLSTNYPEKSGIDKQQFDWLKEDLEKNGSKNIIVMQDTSLKNVLSEELRELYLKNGVDLVISSATENGESFLEDVEAISELRIGKGKQAHIFSVKDEDIFLEVVGPKKQLVKKIKIK